PAGAGGAWHRAAAQVPRRSGSRRHGLRPMHAIPPDGEPLVLATHNQHKVAEVTRLLAPRGIRVIALPDGIELPPETGDTFEANALPKARAAAAATGRRAIADDSGIEAEALGGAPGVRSARYAGDPATDEENLARLMREAPAGSALRYRSEERRVGKECRSRWARQE